MATAHFYRLLIERTPATVDQEHLPVAIWADPTTPDRTEALLGIGPSPVPALLHGLRWLQAAGADCVAIPCNTAHAFRDELVRRSGAEILDMVAAALRHARASHPQVTRIGLLATRGTRGALLYERAAEPLGLEIVHVPSDLQHHVDSAIAAVKRGADLGPAARDTAVAAACLRGRGAGLAIAGCTEIPFVAGEAARILPMIDSMVGLADDAIRRLAQAAS
jgi:aspartate racemase